MKILVFQRIFELTMNLYKIYQDSRMNKIYHDIFKAIHEGKWLKIEYRNKGEENNSRWSSFRKVYFGRKLYIIS